MNEIKGDIVKDEAGGRREQEASDKNKDFTQVYPAGWAKIRGLMKENPNAAHIYIFIAENMDPDGGVLVASQKALAEALELSEITIRRQTKWMEDHNCLIRVRVGSGVYAYALDPDEVWKAWKTNKKYAVFKTHTLARKGDNQTINRKIQVMISEQRKRK